MKYANFLLGLLLLCGSGHGLNDNVRDARVDDMGAEADVPPFDMRDDDKPAALPKISLPSPRGRTVRLDTTPQYPINCNIKTYPAASVPSIKEAYTWFYRLAAPLGADAQQCRRVACFGTSGIWVCADSLEYRYPNSVTIADTMNRLLDGDDGCLVEGNMDLVQGMVFTSDQWAVLLKGGEDCSVEPPEQGIMY